MVKRNVGVKTALLFQHYSTAWPLHYQIGPAHAPVCTYQNETPTRTLSNRSIKADQKSEAGRADRQQFAEISQQLIAALSPNLGRLSPQILWIGARDQTSC